MSELRDPIRYLIIGLPRSGTTVVHIAVMGHPHVAAFSDEIHINPLFTHGLRSFSFGSEDEIEQQVGHQVLFDALASISADEQTSHLGLKGCVQTQRQAHALVNALRQHMPKLKIVLTRRTDLVANFGSLTNARQSGRWHSWNKPQADQQDSRKPTVKFSSFAFKRYALRSLQIMRELNQLKDSHDVFDLHYERLLDPEHTVWAELFEFLALSPMEVAWLKAKKVMPPPETYIANYHTHQATQTKLAEQVEQNRVPAVLEL